MDCEMIWRRDIENNVGVMKFRKRENLEKPQNLDIIHDNYSHWWHQNSISGPQAYLMNTRELKILYKFEI